MPKSPNQPQRVSVEQRPTLLHKLHALTAFLYAYIAAGLIGQLRTVYARLQATYERGAISAMLRSRRKRHDRLFFRIRLVLASSIEQSTAYHALARLRRTLLRCSLNTYGIFSFFFGCFTVVSYLMAQYFQKDEPLSYLVTGAVMIALALPLLLSDRPLGRALGGSLVFRRLLVNICGIPAEKLENPPPERREHRENKKTRQLRKKLEQIKYKKK
jgi:hypothetical protein